MWSDHKKPVETFGASAFSNHQTEYYGENGGYDSVLAIPLLLGCCRWVPTENNIIPSISQVIEGTEVYPMILGDSAFPFRLWLMKPYGAANLTPEEGYFNYRLSRARMITERAYGQLKSRWRVLFRKLECRPGSVKLAALACIVLHNICITTKCNLPVQLDLSIDPYTQKRRSREEIRDLLQMRSCPKKKDSSRKVLTSS